MEKMTTFEKLSTLIKNDRFEYENMLDMMDTFRIADRISSAEYIELKQMMDAKQKT